MRQPREHTRGRLRPRHVVHASLRAGTEIAHARKSTDFDGRSYRRRVAADYRRRPR